MAGEEGPSLDAYIENLAKRWGQDGECSFYDMILHIFLVLIMLVKPQKGRGRVIRRPKGYSYIYIIISYVFLL